MPNLKVIKNLKLNFCTSVAIDLIETASQHILVIINGLSPSKPSGHFFGNVVIDIEIISLSTLGCKD